MGLRWWRGKVTDYGEDTLRGNLSGSGDTDIIEGNVEGHGKRITDVTVRDSPSQEKKEQPKINVREIWALGSFLLLAFLIAAAVVGVFSYKLPIAALPIGIAGAIVVLYVLGVMLLPDRLTERNLVAVLREFFRLAFHAGQPRGSTSK